MNWSLEIWKIKNLKFYAQNPRKLTKEEADNLDASIRKFGICQPIVINRDGTVIGGHQRVRLLHKMGRREVSVYVPDTLLSSKEVEELNIRLNKNCGHWDWDILGNAFDVGDLIEWGFSLSELEIGDEEEKEEKKKSVKMAINFSSYDQLEDLEPKIAMLISEYPGTSYKISA